MRNFPLSPKSFPHELRNVKYLSQTLIKTTECLPSVELNVDSTGSLIISDVKTPVLLLLKKRLKLYH